MADKIPLKLSDLGSGVGKLEEFATTDTVPLTHGGTGAATASAARAALGLGTAAVEAIGTSGATVPLLNAANTWSATQTWNNDFVFGPGYKIRLPNTGAMADNLYFTSANTNTGCNIHIHPNGTSQAAGFLAYNSSDVNNASRMQFFINASGLNFASNQTGSGSYLPMLFNAGSGGTKLRLEIAGTVNPGGNGTQDLGSSSLQFKDGYFSGVLNAGGAVFTGPVKFAPYLLSTLPSAAANSGAQIYVSNLTGGAECCTSNGTNWQRNSDKTTAS